MRPASPIARSSLVVLLLLAACRTAPLENPEPIAVPRGLTAQQVEVAILAGILNKPPPDDYRPGGDMDRETFDEFVWHHFLVDARTRSWFPESRQRGLVVAAVNTRGHYLKVEIRHDTELVTIQVVESRNLQQSGGRIHKRALAWLRNLEVHIRRELGRMAVG